MEKPQYQYQPLQNNDTIRILTLDPGQRGDPLTGTLEVVPIDAAGSYVPDWRLSEGIVAEPICPHRAHGDSTAKLEIVGEDDLGLRGRSTSSRRAPNRCFLKTSTKGRRLVNHPRR